MKSRDASVSNGYLAFHLASVPSILSNICVGQFFGPGRNLSISGKSRPITTLFANDFAILGNRLMWSRWITLYTTMESVFLEEALHATWFTTISYTFSFFFSYMERKSLYNSLFCLGSKSRVNPWYVQCFVVLLCILWVFEFWFTKQWRAMNFWIEIVTA